eukprot:2531725-Alexandrium_andersonii.AAC.1
MQVCHVSARVRICAWGVRASACTHMRACAETPALGQLLSPNATPMPARESSTTWGAQQAHDRLREGRPGEDHLAQARGFGT